jgi:N-acetylglucosaminyldiphosphoundecaprenol N-acetyl-beta-D-mannosaminyltransferase
MDIRDYNLLGLRLHAMTANDIVGVIAGAIANRKRYIVAHHNLHSLYICHHESSARTFYDGADYIHIDGMALVGLGRLLGIPFKREHRATYIDLLPCLLAEAALNSWRIFYLGSKPGVAERAATKLRAQYPGLLLRTHHGYFDTEPDGAENVRVLREIRAYAPHILFVGMGMPRQENWIVENEKLLSCNAALCCGAAFDYVGGEIPTPPRWMGQLGLEWLYRLGSEPQRLWRRYLVEPWFLVGAMARHYFGANREGWFRAPFK